MRVMNEHEQIAAVISARNETPVRLDARRTALMVVDMQRYFTEPLFPFTEVFNRLSPGAASGYLSRVREVVVPSIQRLLAGFRALQLPIFFTATGTESGGRDLPCWLRGLDELGLATLGKRIWPPSDDPSWQIDGA